jgi:hypothetical protein
LATLRPREVPRESSDLPPPRGERRAAARGAIDRAPRSALDILDRRNAVSAAMVEPARELLVRVVSMLARLAST